MTSAELTAQLQAARPVAGDGLREHVRAIAARPQTRERRRLAGLSRRRLTAFAIPATAVVAMTVAGVAGFARSDAPRSTSEAAAAESVTAGQGAPAEDRVAAPSAKLQAGAGVRGTVDGAPAPATDRAQRYSAQLAIEVEDTDALSSATQQALTTTRELGGYVVSVSFASADSGTATMTLRVPTAKVQDAVVRLSSLGTIISQQVQIDDLQGQVDELAKQETALRARIARLSARLTATDLDSTTRATLQAQRDAARAELARVRSGQAQVDTEASYATIQVGLTTPQASLVPTAPSRFDRALDEAGRILAWEATVLVYAAVLLVPPALLLAAGWYALRATRRRSDERLLSAS